MINNQHITSEILSAIEDFWGFGLPRTYRDFLINIYDKDYSNKIFDFPKSSEGFIVDKFFYFQKGLNHNILIKFTYMGTRVPNNMLPIAREVFGNLILLSVKGPDRGKVYFWDHEMECAEGEIPDYSNLTLIADSFEEFIDGLKDESKIVSE